MRTYKVDLAVSRNIAVEAGGAHTQLGSRKGRSGTYNQAREFDAQGNAVKDIDFTDHGTPEIHPNPRQHHYVPNSTWGTPQRGGAVPLGPFSN